MTTTTDNIDGALVTAAPTATDLNGTAPFKSRSFEDELHRRGDEAWDNLRASQDWPNWLTIGASLMHARTTIMQDTHSNRPAGRAYNTAFSAWLAKRKFGTMDGSARARLFTVMENLAAIESWRATLTGPERLRLNHPTTVLRKWTAATKVPDSTKPKRPSPWAAQKEAHLALIEEHEKLIEEKDKLIEENDKLRQRIPAADGDKLDARMEKTSPESQQPERVIDLLGVKRVRQVIEAIDECPGLLDCLHNLRLLTAAQRAPAKKVERAKKTKPRCVSGTFHNDGGRIHEAVKGQQQKAIRKAAARDRRRRPPEQLQMDYAQAMAEKHGRSDPRAVSEIASAPPVVPGPTAPTSTDG